MGYMDEYWWHQCNDFHGSLWLHKMAKECCHCGFKQEDKTGMEFKDGGNVNEL